MGINLNHSKIVIKDLVLPWSIGVFTHEKKRTSESKNKPDNTDKI